MKMISVFLLCILTASCGVECRFCKSKTQDIPIVYGLPGHDLIEQEKEGKIILGGCFHGEAKVAHQCIVCKARNWENSDEWSKLETKENYIAGTPNGTAYFLDSGHETFIRTILGNGKQSWAYYNRIDSEETDSDATVQSVVLKIFGSNNKAIVSSHSLGSYDFLKDALAGSGSSEGDVQGTHVTVTVDRRPRIKYITVTYDK